MLTIQTILSSIIKLWCNKYKPTMSLIRKQSKEYELNDNGQLKKIVISTSLLEKSLEIPLRSGI